MSGDTLTNGSLSSMNLSILNNVAEELIEHGNPSNSNSDPGSILKLQFLGAQIIYQKIDRGYLYKLKDQEIKDFIDSLFGKL